MIRRNKTYARLGRIWRARVALLLLFVCGLQSCSLNRTEDCMKDAAYKNRESENTNANIELGGIQLKIKATTQEQPKAKSNWKWKQMIFTVLIVSIIHLGVLLPIYFVEIASKNRHIDNLEKQVNNLDQELISVQNTLTACLNSCP